GSRSRANQLIHHMMGNSLVNILDLRMALMTAKAEHRIYDKTGTHWNCYGALVGYEQLMLVVAQWFPSMRVSPRQAFVVDTKEHQGGDLARMLNLADVLPERVVTVEKDSEICPRGEEGKPRPHAKSRVMRVRRPGVMLPRLLMFGDSFGGKLVPYLSEHFSEIVFVGSGFIPELVHTEHPDIVVEQMVERRLMKYP
ncbi:MAG: hypothetical protein OEU36_10810, partial [Gammaproteobacteria bacterium]|nr:hypothetical protein [Gammaproteobacteria bacterium]